MPIDPTQPIPLDTEPRPITRQRLEQELAAISTNGLVAEGETWKPGAHSKLRRVTCISCSGTFTAYVYPPPQCELCGISFDEQLETKPGDTLVKVKARAARKALRKGRRR